MHEHCEHELKHCEKCNVVYCEKCGEEWGKFPAGIPDAPVVPYAPPVVPYPVQPFSPYAPYSPTRTVSDNTSGWRAGIVGLFRTKGER